MRPTFRYCLSTLIAVVTLVGTSSVPASTVLQSQTGQALAGFHSTQIGVPATGAVNVFFGCNPETFFEEVCRKEFNELATHELIWGASFGRIEETVLNATPASLTGFSISFSGLNGSNNFNSVNNFVELELDFDPLDANIDPLSIIIAEHAIQFGFLNPLAPGHETSFAFDFQSLNGAGPDAFQPTVNGSIHIAQTPIPTVPEPTTLALFTFGLATAGFATRRRKATAT